MFDWLRKKKRIGDLVAGEITSIKGVVQSERKLAIPPSGTSCVYYSLMEERFGQGQRGRGRPLWFPERMERRCVEFTVSDNTGLVTVRESGERMRVTGSHREQGLVRNNRKRRFFADFIRSGDTVVIRGQVEASPGGAPLGLVAPGSKDLKISVTGSIE